MNDDRPNLEGGFQWGDRRPFNELYREMTGGSVRAAIHKVGEAAVQAGEAAGRLRERLEDAKVKADAMDATREAREAITDLRNAVEAERYRRSWRGRLDAVRVFLSRIPIDPADRLWKPAVAIGVLSLTAATSWEMRDPVPAGSALVGMLAIALQGARFRRVGREENEDRG